MNDFDRIDLHMHTTVSDGTDTPEEILTRVKEAGIGLFSVTDHDAIKAGRIIPGLLGEGDPRFLSGVEFSCKDEEGKYHILGYGYDPDGAAIRRVVEHGHRLRVKKVVARLEFLKSKFGVRFPEEELAHLLARDNPGKPHIGNLMVAYGYAETKEEAIERYINQIHFRSEYVRPEEAIRGILGAGGIPVLAHPSYGSGDQLILGDAMDRRIRRLMEYGLKGLEAFYSGFSGKLCREILSFARRYDLYVTAGSDYHGRNKLVELGDTGLGSLAEPPEGLRRFLSDVAGAVSPGSPGDGAEGEGKQS
jgi:predicted metal-dependent phosphoesterase TrpH